MSGIYSYIKIPKEGNPEVKIPLIYVMVSQKGISPEDARKMILQPLETGLQGLEDVKEVTSYAYDGGVSIKVEFNAGVDPDKSLDDVRNKVNDTKPKLPRDSDQPIVKQVDLSLIPVVNVVLTADLSKRELLAVARNARDIIMKIPFVRDVNISGSVDEAVQIIIKLEMIERYAISTDYLKKIISSNNLLVTAGTIQKKDGEFAIKIPGLIDKYDELMEFPVYNSNGKVLKLKDVATVVRDFKDVNVITRANGKNSIILEVSKRSGQNVIDTVAATKFVVEEAKQYWPKEVSVVFANDTSNRIMDMVHELENGILFAALLVMIIIIMSVGIKSAILIALSLPVSFFGCILIMDICGYSLNIVVLFSLILTVGMVVDDAIVVTEYADRKLIEGKSSEESYLEATKRMFVPIFTATLVKIIVFLPFLFWPGTLGQFMKYMPITVLIIMTNSLVFALLLQPAIGSILMRNHPPVSDKEFKAITAAETGKLSDIKGFIGKYITLLERFMEKPRKFVWGIVGLMIITFVIFSKFSVGVEFSPKIEPDNATVIVRSTGDTSIWEKNAILKEVEQEMFKFKDSVKVFYTKVGLVDSSKQLPDDTIGTISLEFNDWKTREKASKVISEMLKATKDISGVIIEINEERSGLVSGKPIQMNIFGRNHEHVDKFTKKLREAMDDKIGGFRNINDSLPIPGVEWHLEIDRELAAKYLLSTSDVGSVVQMSTNGLKISTCRLDDLDYEVDIIVRFPEGERLVSKIDSIRIINADGDIIPINKFVTQIPHNKLNKIKRVDLLSCRELPIGESSLVSRITSTGSTRDFISSVVAAESDS